MIERWGALVVRRALVVLIIGLILAGVSVAFGVGLEDKLSNGGFDDPKSEATRELVLERDTFGNKTIDAIAVYTSADLVATDAAFQQELTATLDAIPQDKVTSVVSWFDTGDPSMLSHDKHSVSVFISLAGDTQNEFAQAFRDIEDTLRGSALQADIAGPYAVYTDVNEETKKDLAKAELISMPFVLLLSLIIFRSLTAALMPVLVGLVAVVGARAVIAFINSLTEVSIFAPNIITLIGLGLAIDYALFVVSRFREEIGRNPDDVKAALITTMGTAGRTVTFSALTVAASMSSLLVFPQVFLKSIGYGGIAAVIIAMLAALTVLPAALALLGNRINSLKVPGLKPAGAVDEEHGAWARLAHSVMRRPIVYAGVVIVGLLFVASPFLGAKWGSVDYRVLPEHAPAHQAAELLNDNFGPERSTANVLLTNTEPSQVTAYTAQLRAVPGVLDVRPVEQSDGTVLLRAAWAGNSQSEYSQDMVRRLRDVAEPPGTTALIGGLTADTVDLATSIRSHLPWMGLIVVAVMLVLLFIAFGSVVLPIKAVVMNFFSITASFGVITWIFSDGHLSGPLGFESPGYLDLTNPIVMLAVLFGLSMDYEVFLLSRVREEWDRTHDNQLAVATGVQKTGRIITSAALLLAIVIGAFSLSGVVFMKLIGIGMLVALLIDATVVRALLVPATMKLLGRWNWWAPAPLARWWQRYGFREEPAAPEKQLSDVIG